MNTKLSRRKIAEYVAENIKSGKSVSRLLDEVAAYLLETNQVRNAELMTRAIEDALAERGVVVATVASARKLDATERKKLTTLIDATDVHMKETVDPSLIGGVRLEMPGSRLDSTVKRKLTALQGAKI